ncbi:hypothetical protein ACHAWF_018227 [Thalassiosira exigua]
MWRIGATGARCIARGVSCRRPLLCVPAGSPSPTKACPPPPPPLSRAATVRSFSSPSDPADYQCVHVFVSVKPGTEDDFLAASLANARASSREPGVARFDVIQQEDDPAKFVLVEVYKTPDAPAAHKGTDHYAEWREAVEDMMAEPRRAIKYRNRFPATKGGWDYGADMDLE